MAIEFQCPACQAVIRVADHASGKRGRCPSCGEVLMVPVVAPPTDRQETLPDPDPLVRSNVEQSTAKHSDNPFAPPSQRDLGNPSVTPAPDFPDLTSEPGAIPEFSSSTDFAVQVRQRQKKRSRAWILPVVLGSLLIGIVVYGFWPKQDLKFVLEARVVSSELIPVGRLHRSNMKADSEPLEFVLDDLEKEPQVLSSRQLPMGVELRASSQGLEFRVFEASGGRTVEVQMDGNPRFRRVLDEQAVALDKVRTREFETNALAFISEWYEARRDFRGRLPANLGDYRDSIALNSLRQALGYHLEAVIDNRRFPCVHQRERKLYFILPDDVKRFTLRSRRIESGVSLPAGLMFDVTIREPDSGNDESSESAEADASDN